MASINSLIGRATSLSGQTAPGSVTPKEVGGLILDTLNYMSDRLITEPELIATETEVLNLDDFTNEDIYRLEGAVANFRGVPMEKLPSDANLRMLLIVVKLKETIAEEFYFQTLIIVPNDIGVGGIIFNRNGYRYNSLGGGLTVKWYEFTELVTEARLKSIEERLTILESK